MTISAQAFRHAYGNAVRTALVASVAPAIEGSSDCFREQGLRISRSTPDRKRPF